MKPLDKLLNSITMYRLLVYGLAGLALIGVIFSLIGRLAATPLEMLVSLALLLISALITDRGMARLFNVPSNSESWMITALILFLIVHPIDSASDGLMLVAAGALSSASKFLIATYGKHLFNPAALAAAFLSLSGLLPVTWWIGNSWFWPFTLVFGLLIVHKIRRVPLYITFVAVSILMQTFLFMHGGQSLVVNMKQAIIASPLLFLAGVMLTEPATMPPRRHQQIIFAGVIGMLYVTAWNLGPLVIYPEVALLFGNLYAYAVSPKFRVRLRLTKIEKISDKVFNYIFMPNRPFSYLPGQYMEWTLAGIPYNNRGNRRTFTLASSPTEREVQLGVKYFEPASAYKMKLFGLKPGDSIYASQLAGNFTLAGNEHKKLAFIAGGIGITPYRSMVKYLIDKRIKADVVLIYIVSDPAEFAYKEVWHSAAAAGIKVVPVITHPDMKQAGVISAKISAALFKQLISDYNERTFYLSGSNAMVQTTKNYLHELGIAGARLKTDYFSGY